MYECVYECVGMSDVTWEVRLCLKRGRVVEQEEERKKWAKGGEVCSKWGCSKGGRKERKRGGNEGRCGTCAGMTA